MKQTLVNVLSQLTIEDIKDNPSFQLFLADYEFYPRFGGNKLALESSSNDEWWVTGFRKAYCIHSWEDDPHRRLEVVTGVQENPNAELSRLLCRYFIEEEEKKKLFSYLSDKEWFYSTFYRENPTVAVGLCPEELSSLHFSLASQRTSVRMKKEGHEMFVVRRHPTFKNIGFIESDLLSMASIVRFKEIFDEEVDKLAQ